MSTKLEKLLDSIDPARTYDLASARASNALNTFEMKSAQITDGEEFNKYIEKFFMHVFGEIGQTKVRRGGMDFWYNMCMDTLCKIYGPNGERAAFDMARTGNEGGLYAVLRALAMKTAEEVCKSHVRAKVFDFWSRLSYAKQKSVTKEYLEKYGYLLPSMTEGEAERLWLKFDKVLPQHPLLLQKFRSIAK